MSLEKLVLEITEREVQTTGIKVNKKNMEQSLKKEMTGIIRTPALCYKNELDTLHANLNMYEVSPIEPLHDTKGHIRNLWEALPEILPPDAKTKFGEILDTCYGSKTKVRGCDYRLSTILVHQNLKAHVTEDIQELLSTLVEVCEWSYKGAEERTTKSILRLFNVTLKHAMICCTIFKKTKMSTRKLFGIYFHSITTHLPEVARIIAPSSLHTENEERLFSDLNSISMSTSSRSKESIRDNAFLRIQMEAKWNEANKNGSVSKMKGVISTISKFSKQGIYILYIYMKNKFFYLMILFQNIFRNI